MFHIHYSFNVVFFSRLQRPSVTHKYHPPELRHPVGHAGRQVLWSPRSTVLAGGRKRSGKRRHRYRDDFVQSE